MSDKKQKKKSSGSSSKKENKVLSFFKDEKVKYIIGLFCLFSSLYLAFAFISYIFTWKQDQSVIDIPFGELLTNNEITIDNWAGKTGAMLSNRLICDWFGISSFSIPFLLFIIGFRLLKIRLLPLRKTIKFTIIATLWLSVSFAFIFGNTSFKFGGLHGQLAAEWLNSFFGIIGTAFILLIILLAFILFTFDKASEWIKCYFGKIFNPDKNQDQDQEKNQNQENETINEINDDEPNEDIDIPSDIETDLVSPKPPEDISISKSEEEESDPEKDLEKPKEIVLETKIPVKEKKEIKEDIEFTIENKSDQQEETVTPPTKQLPSEDFDPTLELSNYKFPPIKLLQDHHAGNEQLSPEEMEKILKENNNKIIETLGHYKIEIAKISATVGPTVTLYEIVPAPGVRISKIKNLEDDIALSLAALGIRIIAPIPGKGTIGIEVPNPHPEIVSMKSIIASKTFQESKFDLPLALGKTISNETYVVDLAKMPHMLVAGATGQGKSVGINAILTSLLYKKHPSQIKFVLIDPKKVELSIYTRIEQHYLAKLPDTEEAIITDTQKVVNTMNSLCMEMDTRYDMLKKASCRNIKEYNSKFIKRKLNPEKGHKYLPYIVVVIDEFADLIMTAGKEIEVPIARLAQLARAIGIHLIIATQRPSTNIITGVIKANFPARVAFRVSSMIDSRTILDSPGANQLI
ncbi:MAG: cell division protein FtsK, partial [Marinilabiliales bacterium]